MSKAEVIQKMGEPTSTRANEQYEFLIYLLREHATITPRAPQDMKVEYFVRFKNGRVDSFGKVGDFGSTLN